MANYTSTANVVLSVNGKQAQQVLSTLQRDASNLEKNIANATTQTSQSTLTSSVRRTALKYMTKI